MSPRDESYFRRKLITETPIEGLYPNDQAKVSVLYTKVYGLAMDALYEIAFPDETRKEIIGLTRKINKILRDNRV